jgi:hypothetical protein
MRAGFVPAPLAFLCLCATRSVLAAAACLLIAACSPGAEYPSIFPAVHDMPPPRVEAPMDQVQVQKATEDLITQRDHLNAQAPPSTGQAKATTNPASGASADQTGSAVKKRAAARKVTAQQDGATPPATTASAQGAGAEPKP